MRCGVTVIDNMLFLLNSVKILDRVGPKSFLHSSMTMNNKESLSTDRFERLNFEQLLYKSLFTQLLLARLHKKNNSCKVLRPRLTRDREETWNLRVRDSKKRVSRHVSRQRPSLETPSLPLGKSQKKVKA